MNGFTKQNIIKSKLQKKKYLIIYFNLLFFLLFSQVLSQTKTITGKVMSDRYSIPGVLITFTDNNDTTKKYSTVTDNSGNYQLEVQVVTSIGETEQTVKSFQLAQNYPNPFSSSTSIAYKLKKQAETQVSIYDILGREVRKFSMGLQTLGTHSITWDGLNKFGQKVSPGIYFYRLQSGSKSQIKKMIFNSGFINPVNSTPGFLFKDDPEENMPNVVLQENDFSIKIENSEDPFPVIVEKQIDHITVQKDTTINFDVTFIITAKIDLDNVHQIIQGFGAANILQWRPDMTDSEIQTAFGTGEGQLGFSILRIRVQPEKEQWNTNVATAKKAHDMGALIIASPWSPPASMKTNNNTTGGNLMESSYADYAGHLNEFTDFMTENDIPLYAISVQNEPDIQVSYESCDWTPSQMVKFLKEQGASINTKVIAPESFQFRKEMSDPILNDSAACANLDIVGGHIYGGGLVSYPLAEAKGKEVWMTEHLTESAHSANVWSLAMDVGMEMQKVMQANMNAYIWWYIVRYYGPIADGEVSAQFPNEDFSAKGEVTKKGFVMSQFSRFIRPGYSRINCAIYSSSSNVSVTAYKDSLSSKTVIVAVNDRSTATELVLLLQNGLTNTFTPYTTSETKNVVQGDNIMFNANRLTVMLDASSVTTFVSE